LCLRPPPATRTRTSHSTAPSATNLGPGFAILDGFRRFKDRPARFPMKNVSGDDAEVADSWRSVLSSGAESHWIASRFASRASSPAGLARRCCASVHVFYSRPHVFSFLRVGLVCWSVGLFQSTVAIGSTARI
jgi:hypothetical protein